MNYAYLSVCLNNLTKLMTPRLKLPRFANNLHEKIKKKNS